MKTDEQINPANGLEPLCRMFMYVYT